MYKLIPFHMINCLYVCKILTSAALYFCQEHASSVQIELLHIHHLRTTTAVIKKSLAKANDGLLKLKLLWMVLRVCYGKKSNKTATVEDYQKYY